MIDYNQENKLPTRKKSEGKFIFSFNVSVWIQCLVLTMIVSCEEKSDEPLVSTVTPETLPMKSIQLNDFQGLKEPGKNWSIVGNVLSDYDKENDIQFTEGKGIILNQPIADSTNLTTEFEHGDISLELDFLLPKGSNSGVYLQGRYEVQIFDSWNVESPTFADNGGIYQRWDETKDEGLKGYEGTAPIVNASKAPGLWQHLEIEFRAPRFDENGNKIANAMFESVALNGYTIHENIEVTGPSRGAFYEDEKALGPIVIQGDHGAVALKNINYKSYTLDAITIQNLSYKVYEDVWHELPDFSKLEPVRSGTDSIIQVSQAAGKPEYFGLVYEGDITIPVSGDYLFTSYMDEGGELFIDNKSVLKMDDGPGGGLVRELVTLEAGKFPFKLSFFQYNWGATARIWYEGPGISFKSLAAPPEKNTERTYTPLLVNTENSPEMVRSFIQYRDTVKTHVISIGSPENVHYTYDLQQGALIKTWKGVFADAHGMWDSRGESQLLQPGNFSIEPLDGLPIALLASDNSKWPTEVPDNYLFEKYIIDTDGYPLFHYSLDGNTISDEAKPAKDGRGLTRKIEIKSKENNQNLWFRLASSSKVELLSNGLYNIGGEYYLRLDGLGENEVNIRDNKELLFQIKDTETTLQYTMIW